MPEKATTMDESPTAEHLLQAIMDLDVDHIVDELSSNIREYLAIVKKEKLSKLDDLRRQIIEQDVTILWENCNEAERVACHEWFNAFLTIKYNYAANKTLH